mmetsp:Transcript_61109/g.108686  ORF Transcript_61109/g.108686 Transcript_61109/m.108686 type:complete len:201 (-) Transcript_61109:111-713(-)
MSFQHIFAPFDSYFTMFSGLMSICTKPQTCKPHVMHKSDQRSSLISWGVIGPASSLSAVRLSNSSSSDSPPISSTMKYTPLVSSTPGFFSSFLEKSSTCTKHRSTSRNCTRLSRPIAASVCRFAFSSSRIRLLFKEALRPSDMLEAWEAWLLICAETFRLCIKPSLSASLVPEKTLTATFRLLSSSRPLYTVPVDPSPNT